jgi:CO/xanthine dehydrogenase Mo-binding subunit
MSTRAFGSRVKRNIDPQLLRGEGAFIDDIPLANPLAVAFVRSPFARARITATNVEAARRHPGVVAVYTCDDIGALDREMPLLIPHPSIPDARTQRPLARGDVYYVGQTVVMVVAADRYVAEDAAALVEVDYEPLDVELNLERAVEDGAPLVHPTHPNNSRSFRAGMWQPGQGHRRRRARDPHPRAGGPLDGGAARMSRRGSNLRRC